MNPKERDRTAFTKAIIAALEDLDHRKAPSAVDLANRAYQKLQFDLPLVSTDELHGLEKTLRSSLQLKSQQPPFPLTSKLLENIVAGARAPSATTAARATVSPAASTPADGSRSNGEDSKHNDEPKVGAAQVLHEAAGKHDSSLDADNVAASAATQSPSAPSGSLLQPGLLSADRQSLCAAYRSLCSVVFVQLVAHCLSVSEQETWALLRGAEPESGGEGCAENTVDDEFERTATGGAWDASRTEQEQELPEARDEEGADGAAGPLSVEERPLANGDVATNGACQQRSEAAFAGALPHTPMQPQPPDPREEPMAAEEDGDDFVFEDLEAPGPTACVPQTATGNGCSPSRPCLPSTCPPPYSWPALRCALLRVAGQVSYAGLLDDPELWADGSLLAGVLQLLRALGAHRYAQELSPLLGAYVGLLADRVAAEPGELGCLEGLWDAVGLSCIASMPAQGCKLRQAVAGRQGGQGPLLTEVTTCLSVVASLAGQLSAASARQRLWQQVHCHMLPLLERCLGELARAVGTGQGPAAGKAAAARQASQWEPDQARKGPGPEDVAAIVLVCQVLDFYVQQRPGNADLGAALKGSGVLASLAVLFAAAGSLPGAEPLRSAALCCAATSRELTSWILAVPGVSKALAAPAFQEGGPYESHGAMWELLSGGGTSPLVLSILSGGAAPEKAVRVHSLLQLLSMAAACRGGTAAGGAALWGPAVERALRDLLAALREEQSSVSRPGCLSGGVGRGADEGGAAGAGDGAMGGAGARDGDDGEEDDDDEEKLRLLDPDALQRRRARQLHPACWRILKQLLTATGPAGGKTD